MLNLQPTCHCCDQEFPVDKLSQCSRCKVVYYCSAEHQARDYPRHSSVCHNVKSTRGCLEEYEATRAAYLLTPFVKSLAAVGTSTAVVLALGIAKGVVHNDLQRSVSSGVPTMMLLLGQWQEAYDFMKWSVDTDRRGRQQTTTSVPEFPKADVTEPIDVFQKYRCEFTMAALTWIKHQVAQLVDAEIQSKATAEPTSRPALTTSKLKDLLWAHEDVDDLDAWKQLHKTLETQATATFNQTQQINRTFWTTMLAGTLAETRHGYGMEARFRGRIKPWVNPNLALWCNSKAFIEREWQRLTPDEISGRASIW